MTYVPCDEYIGEPVVVSYFDEGSQRWISEQSTVLEDPYGMILLSSSGPAVGAPYWVGKVFTSVMRTLPLRTPNNLNAKARLSQVDTYLEESQGGSIEVGAEGSEGDPEVISYQDTERFSGKIQTLVNGGYTEGPYVEIVTDSIHPFRLLALDMKLIRYSK